ncbi:MAG TPA: beta-galactosidase [Candidatus Acidoferrales bacterium]|nr:beta-galactosidase [Candidatus Acidoferrales bacterium]
MLRSRLIRFAAALVCAAGYAYLSRDPLPAAAQGVRGAEQHPGQAEAPAGPRGVHIAQHGGYPELRVDGKPFFVNSAAFFYPRIPRSLWESSLERYRELGINTIELSILWNWHEPHEGEMDFDGHSNPRRDLRGLLQLVARKGFKLIARPGPTVLKEWRNGGYPDWLLERPEYRMPLVDRLEGRLAPDAERNEVDAEDSAQRWLDNPVHMRYAKEWLEAVARELAPYRAEATLHVPAGDPAGGKGRATEREISGPLLFVQVEEGLGSGRGNPAGPAFWKYVETLCGFLAEGGVDAQCFINPAQPRSAVAGTALERPVATMGQWHLNSETRGGEGERRITPVDAAELEFTVASLSTQPAFPPVLIEYDAGGFAPKEDTRPPPSPVENTGVSSHLLLGYGLRGLSWFPMQDTLTPAGFETPGANRHHRWDAALSLNGTSQPRAREAARLGEWLRAWGSQLAAAHRRADFGLVESLASLRQGKPAREDLESVTNTTMQLERLAQYAGMSSELVDPEYQPPEQLLRHALLLLPVYRPGDAAYALSEKAQSALEHYVRGGGVLVCFPGQPSGAVFESMEKGTAVAPAHLPAGSMAWNVGAGRLVVLTKDFYSWISIGDEFAEGLRRFQAPFALTLLDALLAEAGVRQTVRRSDSKTAADGLVATEIVSNEGTLALGERSSGQGWLSVVNPSNDTTITGTLQVLSPRVSARSQKDSEDDWVTLPVTLPPRESLLLPLEFRLCLEPEKAPACGDRVSSSSAELVRAEREGKAMYLTFYAPAKATAQLHLASQPDHLEVDEEPVNGKWDKASHELTVEIWRGASPHFLRVLKVPLHYTPALVERSKQDWRHAPPARFRFSPAGAARLPLGEGATLLTNPPLFVFQRGGEGSIWVKAESLGGEGADVHGRAAGEFNTSAHAYVPGGELRSMNLKIPASTVEKAAAETPAADGLFHGTLHFSSGADSEDLPASYAIVPEKGAIGYRFDFDADGSEERVLEDTMVRAIFSPAEGGRVVALVEKPSDSNLASTMGLLEDVFAFTPNPAGARAEGARGRAGTFNRAYSAEWVPGDDGPALRMGYDAPDVYPHGARIEKTIRFADERRLAVEYRVSLLEADSLRLEEEAAGKIFAAPPPEQPATQAFEILNSVPATEAGARSTQFCWQTQKAGAAGAGGEEHCEAFVPGGPALPLPAQATRLEIRRPRRAGLALEWPGEGARLTLEPRNHTMLLRFVFPPLNPGGAAARYRIELIVMEAP